MHQNTAVKSPAWVPALAVSAILHAAIFVPIAVTLAPAYGAARNMPPETAQQTILAFTIGWCLVASAWTAMVANVLSRQDNRWRGLQGPRLAATVAGLTLALNLANVFCVYSCPATALVIPILSYVAIMNNSVPLEIEDNEPTAHG